MESSKIDDHDDHDFAGEFPPESGRLPRHGTTKREPANWLRLGCGVFAVWMMAGIMVCAYSLYSRIMGATSRQSTLAGHAFVVTARDVGRYQNHQVLQLRVIGGDGRTTELTLTEDCFNWKTWLSLRLDQKVWFCPMNPSLQIFGSEDLSRVVYPCAPDSPAASH